MLRQKKGPAIVVALAKEFVASTESSSALVEGTERSTMGEAPIESALMLLTSAFRTTKLPKLISSATCVGCKDL